MALRWNVPRRYLWISVLLVTTVLYSYTRHHPFSSPAAPESKAVESVDEADIADIPPRRANATFMMLARNSDLKGAISSILSLEAKFNENFGYPYVFLNEVPFTEEFKSGIRAHTNASVEFGVVPPEHWNQPSSIDESLAEESRKKMAAHGVLYGDSVPYRNMCRFNSGFFFKHELMLKYRWYWRVEPDIKYRCTINADPFLVLENSKRSYGFTISSRDIGETLPGLWEHVLAFMREHPEHIADGNSLYFLSQNGGRLYSTCHFWSNFEIADMDFYRSKAYQEFFSYLDSKGGFYYERWGDAPVHSIAASLFLPKDKIHFFDEIGYEHSDRMHCPSSKTLRDKGNCDCRFIDSFDFKSSSCTKYWRQLQWMKN